MGNVEQGEQDFQRQLGRQVRRRRMASGLTQGGLAERLTRSGHPIYQSTVTKIEAGSRPTSAAEVAALARVFRLPPGALFDFSDDDDEPIDELARYATHLAVIDAETARLTAELRQLEVERQEVQGRRDALYASLNVDQRAKQDRIVEAAERDLERKDLEQASREAQQERDWNDYTGNTQKDVG